MNFKIDEVKGITLIALVITIIPDTVQEIGYAAFHDADNITKVKIQSSVKLVDQRAFENCKNLQKVEIDSNSIKTQAFYNCGKLKNVKIYDTPKSLADYGLKQAPQSYVYVE